MDNKTKYFLPYQVATALISKTLSLSGSVKLEFGKLIRNRYFFQLDEEGRKKAKHCVGQLCQSLFMPKQAIAVVENRTKQLDITFLGAAEEDNEVKCKLYMGFVKLLDPNASIKAVAISWTPGKEAFSIKEYLREGFISKEKARIMVEQSLLLHEKQNSEINRKLLFDECFGILERTNYQTNFLSVKEKEGDRVSVDFSLVYSRSILVSEIQHHLIRIAEELQIHEEEYRQWLNDLEEGLVLEHLGVGGNNKRMPFFTFYLGHYDQPLYFSRETNKYESIQGKDENNNVSINLIGGNMTENQTTGQELENLNAVTPSDHPDSPREVESKPQKVYALGMVDIDFGNDSNRDAFLQLLEGNIATDRLINHFKKYPYEMQDVTWVLKSSGNGVPIYAVQPTGAYGSIGHEMLREFLHEGQMQQVEMVAVPGILQGAAQLLSGLRIPIIQPFLRGMSSWSTRALIDEILGKFPDEEKAQEEYNNKAHRIEQFLEKVYFEFRNMGLTPRERAINHAATNIFQTNSIFENAIKEGLELSSIGVESCPLVLPGREMMDVKLTFFNPLKRMEQAKKVYSFTVDVTEVIPVTLGKFRCWHEY